MVNSRSSFPLLANDPDTFKQWLCGGVQTLGKPAVEVLLLNWLAPFCLKKRRTG